MANLLKMAQIQAIEVLRAQQWSVRRIARELGIDRGTVAKYVRQAQTAAPGQNQPNPPTGSVDQNPPNPPAGSPEQNRPNPPAGSSGPASLSQAFHDQILLGLEAGLSSQRIWQDLRDDHGFGGAYDSVKRYVARLQAAQPLPFRRMECLPGQEAQVDFGAGATILTEDGRRRRPHLFRIVLSYSRKAYSEVVYRQTTEDFLRCLENAFWHFGGVPVTIVIDNLKAAVQQADWYDPELNPKIQSFGKHYGIAILPTKPYTPRHKGKVERSVGYAQNNALKGLTFPGLAEQNRHLLDWESHVADTRLHGTTRRQVGKTFADLERAALRPLPAGRFPSFSEGQRSVHRDAHVEVAKAYYSVPPEYLGRQVWVRWDGRLVRVFNQRMESIAVHVQAEPGRFSTQPEHIHSHKISGVERGTAWLLNKVSLIGSQTGGWAEAMMQQRGIEGVRVLQGLLRLADQHPAESIEQACQTARTHGAYRLRAVRALLNRQGDQQEQFEFTQTDPIIRNLGEYEDLVKTAFTKES